MKRASSLVSKLSQCSNSCNVTSRSFLYIRNAAPSLNPCNKTELLLPLKKKHLDFQKNPYRFIETVSQKSLNSRQRRNKEKKDLGEAFESASTSKELLEAFKALEPSYPENDKRLGLACLKVGQCLDSEGKEPETTLDFGLKALKIFESDDTESLAVAMALHLVASANYSLKRFNDSLGYLNRANRILGRIEEAQDRSGFDVRPVIHAVQLLLGNTKTAMGRREEALVNLRKCLEIKEKILDPSSKEIGIAYRDLAEAYVSVLNFKEALPLCSKALEIHIEQLGNNSIEVANDRRLLGVIYCGLEQHEMALEQNTQSQKVLKKWGLNSDLLNTEIDAANIQIALGKYDEAIDILKSVVEQTDKDGENRAVVFIAMAKALCNQEKFGEAKRCLEVSYAILDKKKVISPAKVAESFSEIAGLYEMMNEFETSISMMKRALSIFEKLPQEQHSEGNASARIGWLLLLSGNESQAISYLENAAERLKECFGPKHFAVGYVYNNLGAAYLHLERPQSAAQMFALAKEIMDVSLGPHHADSIEASQNLANAYGAMGSFPLAIEFQQRVIDAWERHGPTAKNELREACRLLQQLKQRVLDETSKSIENSDILDSFKIISAKTMWPGGTF